MDPSKESELARILENRRRAGRMASQAREGSPQPSGPIPLVDTLRAPSSHGGNHQASATRSQNLPPPAPTPAASERVPPAAPRRVEQPPLPQRSRSAALPPPPPSPAAPAPSNLMDRVSSLMGGGMGGRTRSVPETPFMQQHHATHAASEHEPHAAGRSASAQSGGGGGDLFRKGQFNNFRNNPVLVSPNIRPYVNPNRVRGVRSASESRHDQRGGSVASTGHNGTTITEHNPFRSQGFDDFVVAPDFSAPPNTAAMSQPAPPQHRSVSLSSPRDFGVMGVGHNMETRPELAREASPAVHGNVALDSLRSGDWFMKWTRRHDRVHRRYFWLDTGRSVLFWAKSPKSNTYLSSCIKLEEVVHIHADCLVEDTTGKTYYIMVIYSTARDTQIGTESREKFDLWYETILKLTETPRLYNAKYHARFSTLQQMTQQNVEQQRLRALPTGD